jgi:lipopolysaccharide assembly protein A
MKFVRRLLVFVVLVSMITAGVFFAAANDAAVPLNLLFHTFEPRSLALWVLGSFALGGFIGMLVSSAIMVRLRASLGASKRQLQRTQTELNGLREGTSLKEAV